MRHEKTPRIIVVFHTTAEAMATEKICKERGLPGKLISAPRALSADCGIAWSGPLESAEELKKALEEEKLEVAGFHEMEA